MSNKVQVYAADEKRKDKDILQQKFKVICFESIYKSEFICDQIGSCIKVNEDKNIFFYFDADGMTHAARYIAALNTTMLNMWTSKLGQGIAVTHMPEDLISQLYGEPGCLAYDM